MRGNYLFQAKRTFLIKYWLSHGVISSAFIITFVKTFHYDPGVIWLHFIPLVLVNIAFYYVLRFFLVFHNTIIFACARWLAFLTTLAYLLIVSSIYTISWVANSVWGGNLTLTFYLGLPRHVSSMFQLLDIPLSVIYASAALVLLLFTVFAWLIGSRIVFDIKTPPRNPLFFNTISALLVTFLFSYVILTYEHEDSYVWRGEPILHLFAKNISYANENQRLLEASLDQRERGRLKDELSKHHPTTNIIFIIADGLRADHMGIYGYHRNTTPFLSSLQSDGRTVKVEQATSMCSESACGILSSLSSRGVKYFTYNIYKLNDLLMDVGYKIQFILSSDHSPHFLRDLYGKNITDFHDGRDHQRGLSMHDDTGILAKLNSINNFDNTPHFFYFHFMSTHQLSPKKEEFNQYKPAITFSERRTLKAHSDERSEKAINAYDNGILQFDNFIERLFSILQTKGYLQDSLVILTSDHGEGLGERGNYEHTYHLYQEDIRIPMLFITNRSQDRFRSLDYATQIDIAPTVIDFLGLPIPETWQGQSLLVAPEQERYTFHQTVRENNEVAVIYKSNSDFFKLIANLEEAVFSDLRLFDLNNDPHEQENLFSQTDDEFKNDLVARLGAYFEGN